IFHPPTLACPDHHDLLKSFSTISRILPWLRVHFSGETASCAHYYSSTAARKPATLICIDILLTLWVKTSRWPI
ncbi:hypothetical protein H0H87_004265, partial [Tephrocybe sp. NHM501043]